MLDQELQSELNGEAGAVIEDLLRRNILMPVSELDRALDLQVAQRHLVRREDITLAGRDERGRLFRVPGL